MLMERLRFEEELLFQGRTVKGAGQGIDEYLIGDGLAGQYLQTGGFLRCIRILAQQLQQVVSKCGVQAHAAGAGPQVDLGFAV